MPLTFWLKRFLVVLTGTFAVLSAVSLLRGRPPAQAAGESALWAGIATIIFIATRVYRSRQGQHCELCGDTPESRAGGACDPAKGQGPK